MGAEPIETQTVRGRGPEREAGFYQTTWGPGTGSRRAVAFSDALTANASERLRPRHCVSPWNWSDVGFGKLIQTARGMTERVRRAGFAIIPGKSTKRRQWQRAWADSKGSVYFYFRPQIGPPRNHWLHHCALTF